MKSHLRRAGTTMKGASLIAPFGLRMPEELKEKISNRARSNGRSMNAEIVQILQDAVDGENEKPSIISGVDAKMIHEILDRVIEESLGGKKPT